MILRHAVKTVQRLRRYRKGVRRTYWDQTGPFVPQYLVPMATMAQSKGADVVMAGEHLGAIKSVHLDRLVSTQHSLRFKSLMWVLKHFEQYQQVGRSKDQATKAKKLPVVVWVKGVPVIWNGNHRVTAAILLGRKRILVDMHKKR